MVKILVIEDNPEIRTLTRDLLTAQGFGVETAPTGEEGLEKIERFAPDLLVLDLNLPDGFGLEICREMKRKHPAILIFILTVMASTKDVIAGLVAGADDYMRKPFGPREFIERVKIVLQKANKIQ